MSPTSPSSAPIALTQQPTAADDAWRTLDLGHAATLPVTQVLDELETTLSGLTAEEAATRLGTVGPNALRSHGARALHVLARQLRNPLLILLVGAAVVSGATGDVTDAVLVTVIVALSVGLGFVNEYRSERAVDALHSQIRHRATVTRDGVASLVDVVDLVPGDVVTAKIGDVVPADLRVLDAIEFECDEAVLTGESIAAVKQTAPIPAEAGPHELGSCALMGTIVSRGTGTGVVVQTGTSTAFGRIAVGLGERQAQTAFQAGLQQFSKLLVRVAAVLTTSIFVINLVLHRPFLDALLFSLAIAIGLTPQLLPAIVTVSLSTGARRLAREKVLVKRLVAIEDLGNIATLFTDKTGTLTTGHITFDRAIDADGTPTDRLVLLGLLCNEAIVEHGTAVSGNQLDIALWDHPSDAVTEVRRWQRTGLFPFDHDRRLSSVIAAPPDGPPILVTKGEPESVLARCPAATAAAHRTLEQLFDAGVRVIAVATKDPEGRTIPAAEDEHDLHFEGFLAFADPPKTDVGASLDRLADLGIAVKVITGDNDRVARKLCRDVGLPDSTPITGAQLESLTDDDLAAAIATTTVFARVAPEQKARIIRVARARGADIAFLGDGVNDAVALHHADVGISVDTATDVAKDAADILLLDKDLGVLANGVVEGRRIFANTIKYVLMATSSNFGNMFSAAGASAFLSFLPLLPSQILLNNLLYDVGQMAIPADHVDDEMLARPSQWDIAFIRRFMSFFGPISSIFDFATFGILLGVLHATTDEFRSGWFVESLVTQSVVIFVIRTRRIPFVRSRPSRALLIAVITSATVGALLPFSPAANALGFTALPASFLALLVVLVGLYLALAELGKRWFYASLAGAAGEQPPRRPGRDRAIHRRASRFSHHRPLAVRP